MVFHRNGVSQKWCFRVKEGVFEKRSFAEKGVSAKKMPHPTFVFSDAAGDFGDAVKSCYALIPVTWSSSMSGARKSSFSGSSRV